MLLNNILNYNLAHSNLDELHAIGSTVNICDTSLDYYTDVEDVISHDIVLQMKEYIQHGKTTCYQHCINVSYYSYLICKKLGLNAKSAARAGLLHDLFLYDWHKNTTKTSFFKKHGFTHPKTALDNAKKYFVLSKLEQDIIEKHMWPLTFSIPKYKESLIIILVDKICCLCETLQNNTILRYLFGLSYNKDEFMLRKK